MSSNPAPALPPTPDRISLRAEFEDSGTVDVRFSAPPTGEDPRAGIPAYWRTYLGGVTDEAPGRYRTECESELGRGAIGRVFVAYDSHLDREVAIKELLVGAGETGDRGAALLAMSRFLREARVTGALEHPGIVPVYELGRRVNGALYYTMRIVRGRTLANVIATASAPRERLALVNHFSGLCQAIAYAHSRGIVHRDIKPENVMIGEFGETVVLDWGMAKLHAADADEEAETPARTLESEDLGLTQEGSLCGTPLYMSPEQASGRTSEVDPRSDVWSLGVVLYMLLCGRPPFFGKSLLEIVARVSAGRYPPLRTVDARIPVELAAIVERALRLDRNERYPSARELARDVQAYQAGMHVAAYEYSSWDLLRRFVARQRSAVLASALALVAIVTLSIVWSRRLVVARDRALSAEHHAHENELAASASAASARRSLGEVLLQRAKQALAEGDSVDAELLAARALVQEERADARGIVIAGQSAMRPDLSFALPEAKGCTRTALALSAGFFACAAGRELRSWNLPQKQVAQRSSFDSDVVALAVAADASTSAVALADGKLGFRSLAPANGSWQFDSCGQRPTTVVAAPAGNSVACGNARGEITIFSAGEAKRSLRLGQAVSALALSSDGGLLAAGGELGAVLVYDLTARATRRLRGHSGTVLALAFADHGHYLASEGADRMLRFWDTASGREPQTPVAHGDVFGALAWSEDRRYVALGGKDKTFRILDSRTGRNALVRQQEEAVELVAVSGDASRFASYSRDLGLRVWSLPSAQIASELSEHGNVLALAVGSTPEQLLSAGLGKNGVCLWDLQSGNCTARLPVRLDLVRALAVSPDRRTLALAGSGSQILIWDLRQKIPTQVIDGVPDTTRALAFSLDGQRLIAAGLGRRVRVFDAVSGALLREMETKSAVQTLSLDPRSGNFVAGDQAGQLTIWDASTGKSAAAWRAHGDWVLGSAVAPDGAQLASAGADHLVRIWDLRTHELSFTLQGHDGKVMSVDFSADGTLVASGGEDKSVRLWDAHTGRALAVLPGHAGAVRALRFSGRPALLASGGDDGAIRLWHLEDLTRDGRELDVELERQFGLGTASAPSSGR